MEWIILKLPIQRPQGIFSNPLGLLPIFKRVLIQFRNQREGFMKRNLSKVAFIGTIVTFVVISFGFTALGAEKKVFSVSLKKEKILSERVLQVSGDFKNVIKQGESLNSITDSTDPNLIGAEQTVYWQLNIAIGHVGTERGYTITRSKDGDCFYSRYESTFKVIRKEFPKTETDSSSKHQFIRGTGKYSDLTGGYSCIGKKTEKEDTAKCEGEWEY